ncbi:MAG: hypothetical protein HQL71_05935 [Magnetococcales bacterium]|nr:hypothetical protein [Magnetococcales bacterium]
MMKSFDNTIPFVLLELVVGAVFLLAIIVAVPLLQDRVDTMSAISVTATTGADSAKYNAIKEESRAALLTLNALSKRVDSLLNTNKVEDALANQQKINKKFQVEFNEALNQRIQPILTRFDELDREIESYFSAIEAARVAKLSRKDAKNELALDDNDEKLLPMFMELNKKTDYLLSEHENNILPTLIRLNDNLDLLMQESGKPIHVVKKLQKTTVVPLLKKGATIKVLRSIQATLKEFNIETHIGPGGGSLLLSNFFDFNRFATTLNDDQVAGLYRLADALAKILPCYAKPAPGEVLEKCSTKPSKIGLDALMVQSFSLGGNVGTLRINYNSNLANTRSIYILKTLLTARPDLLKYFNAKGSPLFVAVGKLALTEDVRSRMIVFQFIMEENQEVVDLAN